MSFTIFSQLPAELRLAIWRNSMQSRVVEIICERGSCRFDGGQETEDSETDTDGDSEHGDGWSGDEEWEDIVYDSDDDSNSSDPPYDPARRYLFYSHRPPPALFSVCRESRTEALKSYRLCFGTDACPASIYINPSLDIVYFGFESAPMLQDYLYPTGYLEDSVCSRRNNFDPIRRAEVSSFHYVAVALDSFYVTGEHCFYDIVEFPNTQMVSLVLEAERTAWGRRMVLNRVSTGDEVFVAPMGGPDLQAWYRMPKMARDDFKVEQQYRTARWGSNSRIVGVRRGLAAFNATPLGLEEHPDITDLCR